MLNPEHPRLVMGDPKAMCECGHYAHDHWVQQGECSKCPCERQRIVTPEMREVKELVALVSEILNENERYEAQMTAITNRRLGREAQDKPDEDDEEWYEAFGRLEVEMAKGLLEFMRYYPR